MLKERRRNVTNLNRAEIERLDTQGVDPHLEEDAKGRIWLVDHPIDVEEERAALVREGASR